MWKQVLQILMGACGSCVLDADNYCTGQIEAAGTTEADEPPGWQGGLTTRNLMGVNGSLAEGPPGSVQTQMTDFGNGSAGGGGDVNVFDPANGNYAVMNSANTGATPGIYTNGVIDGNTFGGNGYAMYNGSWWANNAGDSSQTGNAYVGGQVMANYDAILAGVKRGARPISAGDVRRMAQLRRMPMGVGRCWRARVGLGRRWEVGIHTKGHGAPLRYVWI
jgi:hypothetical protein